MTAPSAAGPERETVEACVCAEIASVMGNHLSDDQIIALCDAEVARTAAAVETARREGAETSLREAAGAAGWMEYPASQDPRHWATWLRSRADALRADTEEER